MKPRLLLLTAVAVLASGLATKSDSAVVIFGLGTEFSGAADPQGSSPWITATFDDSFGGSNTVRLTISATNLVDEEFTSEVSFNFNPALDPTALSFSIISNPTALVVGDINTGINAFQADGDGNYDLFFDFPPPPGSAADKFTVGESFVVDITFTSALTAGDFAFLDSGGSKGDFFAAAHIQGIGVSPGSGWIGATTAVPEPSTYAALMGLVTLGIVVYRHRRRTD